MEKIVDGQVFYTTEDSPDHADCVDCFFERKKCPEWAEDVCMKEGIVWQLKQEKSVGKFIVEHNNKTYEFKAFSLIDIYKADPCKPEFIKFLNDCELNAFTPQDEFDCEMAVLQNKTLLNNIQWLIDKGFGKEVIKETKLEPGMVLEREEGFIRECIVCPNNKLMIIEPKNHKHYGGYWWSGGDIKPKTLEDLNINYSSSGAFKIKELKVK